MFSFKIIILCVFAIYSCDCYYTPNVPEYILSKGPFGDIIEGNFFYAYQYCRSIGRKLATPDTEEKNVAFVKYLAKISLERTWTSGNDLSEEGRFLWMVDGSLLTYVDWFPGNPSNSNGNENCVELRKDNSIWKWNDNVCTIKYPIICEVDHNLLPQAIKC